MAKLTGPLMSTEARGTIAERLTFSVRASGQQARFQKAQKDAQSSAQIQQRDLYGLGVGLWRELSTGEQNLWNTEAKGQNMSGFNLFMQEYLTVGFATLGYLILGIATFGNQY